MSEIEIYYVKNEYIEYLRKFDNKVLENKNNKRPYVGVILTIADLNYFAPLSSPKEKHKIMKENIDFMKLDGGRLGVINLNNMIPVENGGAIKLDIDRLDKQYQNLLNEQVNYIRIHREKVYKKAEKLHKLITTGIIPKVLERCCDFKLLEDKSREYVRE